MSMPSLPIVVAAAEPAPGSAAAPRGWPLLRLGFRPFYLGAAAFAALAVPLWILLLQGNVALKPAVPPLLWHAHEMLFGFAVAVIVGFLLTAGRAWTGLATPRGPALAGLVLLWLAARLAALVAPPVVYAVLDLLLLPLVAAVFIRLLLRAGNRRNLPLGGILLGLALANLSFHLAALGWLDVAPLRTLHAGLALIVMIECVIAGRVIPGFTMSAVPGVKLQVPKRLEQATLARRRWRWRRGCCCPPWPPRPLHSPWPGCCMPSACAGGGRWQRGRGRSCGSCTWPMPGCPSACCCWPGPRSVG